MALDGAGNALLIWFSYVSDTSTDAVCARALPTTGTLSQIQVISAKGYREKNGHVAVRSDGNALIVWEGQDGYVRARARASSGALGPIQTIFGDIIDPSGFRPQFAMDKNGNALIAWQGQVSFPPIRRIMARTRSASGVLGAVQTLSGDLADLPAVAVNPAGGGVVVWERWDARDNLRIQMSVGP